MGRSNRNAEVLQLIEREFARFRIKNPGKTIGYPQNLRSLIKSKATRGISNIDIAAAAKITPRSVRNWQTLSARPKGRRGKASMLRELIVVANNNSEREQSVVDSIKKRQDARVTLRSGVVIELPVAELSTSLLAKLCGLELANAD